MAFQSSLSSEDKDIFICFNVSTNFIIWKLFFSRAILDATSVLLCPLLDIKVPGTLVFELIPLLQFIHVQI